MSDEPAQIRAAARTVHLLADDARRQADQILGRATPRWESKGADAYRHRLRERAADFAGRAGDLDDLARALAAHARQVEEHERILKAGLSALPGAAGELVHDAVEWVS